jgi:hypothetical protein
MRVAELFTEIDSNIVLAGLPTITSFPPLERIESFPIKNFKKAHVTEAIQYRTLDRKFDI